MVPYHVTRFQEYFQFFNLFQLLQKFFIQSLLSRTYEVGLNSSSNQQEY
uniref:Uncharacterized protein n=1 Tax=Rhizophora mucronata TaxID=61149 RepID=A0A2P2Q1S3_RHIMU